MDAQKTFRDIFAVFDYLKTQGWSGLAHTSSHFEVMDMGNDELCAVPMPMQPLYRGQSRYYGRCKPSLYRKQWTREALFERELQLADFTIILNEHPEIKERIKAGLKINYLGLAQHYGIPTDILDLTNSPLVAAFFATTTYDSETDNYSPILHTISKGVIYFIPDGGIFDNMIPDRSLTRPIGMEALHRPGEQRAYGRKMKNDEDLNNTAGVLKFFFWHNPNASMKIWRICNGAHGFFPYDPMADKVRNIKRYRIYSEDALQEALSKMPDFAKDITEARDMMTRTGAKFVDFIPFAYTEDELLLIHAQD